MEISRDPPDKIKKILREEVNYCCPIENCKSPYLTWHHFDPPWNIIKHHNPNGMIALCLQHHKEADLGAFTNLQLKQLKYNKNNINKVKGKFNWKRDNLLLIAGSFIFYKCDILLQIKGKNIIWLSKDINGYELINLDLYDINGKNILKMRDNFWDIDLLNIEDIICPPSSNKLQIKSIHTKQFLDLKFYEFDKNKCFSYFKNLINISNKKIETLSKKNHEITKFYDFLMKNKSSNNDDEFINEILNNINDNKVTICTINANLLWPYKIKFNKYYTSLSKGNICSFNFSGESHVGFHIG
jgi:hypothetical protein